MLIKVPKASEMRQKPVSKGIYRTILSKYEVTQTKKGDPMIKVEHTITSPSPNPTEKAEGRKLFDNLVIIESTLFRSNDYVKAATGNDLPEGDISVDELIGLITNVISNKPFLVEVDLEPVKDANGVIQFEDDGITPQLRNVVKKIKAVS